MSLGPSPGSTSQYSNQPNKVTETVSFDLTDSAHRQNPALIGSVCAGFGRTPDRPDLASIAGPTQHALNGTERRPLCCQVGLLITHLLVLAEQFSSGNGLIAR